MHLYTQNALRYGAARHNMLPCRAVNGAPWCRAVLRRNAPV